MLRPTLVLPLALGVLAAAHASAIQLNDGPAPVPRQVAAPSADLLDGTLRLPAPSAGAVRSRGAFFGLQWQAFGKGRWRAEVSVPVSRGPLGLAVQAAGASDFVMGLRVAGGAELLGRGAAERRDQALPVELGLEDVQRWDLVLGRGGMAQITVFAGGEHAPAPGHIALRDDQALTAAAYLDTHERLSDRELALVAQVERDGDGLTEERLLYTVASAWAQVDGPGYSARLAMADDGQSGDGEAGDGRFGVRLPMGLSGSYAARVELSGSWSGAKFLRTTRVTFDVAEPLLALTGSVDREVADARRLRLDLEALPFAPVLARGTRVQVSAEVWAHDEFGHCQPMAWLSRIDAPRQRDGRVQGTQSGTWSLPLWLDTGWFGATGLRPPLELRNVRVQDPDHLGVLAKMDRMTVPAGPLPPLAGRTLSSVAQLVAINTHVSIGAPQAISSVLPNPGLVLSHGYCSGGGTFPSAHFSQPKLTFADPSQNRSHDQFANLIANQAAAFTSFGVVAHSQGGAAALHLLTYYNSPLDRAQGSRRIQSVGSPYQGTPLASLGFFACGVNNNMTPGGAATWLAGIPTWARSEVYFYTTANSGSACQFLTSLLLSDPEDGTTERSRGELPGGNNMGHVTGWCHTTGMSNPAQYTDSSRNAVLDVQAAR